MKYYDENGNELDMRTELDDILDEITDKLSSMTREERLQWFSSWSYAEPLKYLHNIDNTTYIIRTIFNENGKTNIVHTAKRLLEKKE